MQNFIREFWAFGIKQVYNCLFPAYLFLMLALSHLVPQQVMYRYDFMLLACLLMQAFMYFSKLETFDELLVICLFHILGLCMEIFKVKVGSWSYPEFAYTKVCNVPLYSGFMYASVASYMCQAWRRFDLKMHKWPSNNLALLLAAAIYLNFFGNHFMYDWRYVLAIFIVLLFYKAKVEYTPIVTKRYMNVLLSFMLIAFFIWLAENMATFLGAWKYAYQHNTWQMVKWQKYSSWILMVIVSYILVVELKQFKSRWKRKPIDVVE